MVNVKSSTSKTDNQKKTNEEKAEIPQGENEHIGGNDPQDITTKEPSKKQESRIKLTAKTAF
ncbi:MAG: hypothetical protein V7L26_22475 [Nostoc sp.]|uniref:hypothetical protein n=1 Tax=Nostoc sp. TaxID=1180 RepID=UPI002FFC509F